MHPEWNQMAIEKWLFASEDYCLRCFCTYTRPFTSTSLVAIEGQRRRKKTGWTKIESKLKRGCFSSPFHLKSRLVCSSASGGIEDPWHQQTQIWLKCSHCWLRTSEWHLLSAWRDAFRCIAAGEDRKGCDSCHTIDCQVVWRVRWSVTREYFVLWRTWSIYNKAIAAALRG